MKTGVELLCEMFANVPADEPVGKGGGRILDAMMEASESLAEGEARMIEASLDAGDKDVFTGTRNVDGKKMSAEDIEESLGQFSGTTQWFKWSALFPRDLLTDGTQFLAEAAQCYWLMDVIASAQIVDKVKKQDFQVWHIRVHHGHPLPPKPWPGPGEELQECSGRYAWVWATDGRGSNDTDPRLLYIQLIPFTDFPLAVARSNFTPPHLGGNPGAPDTFKLYAARNELGGITILLPGEY